MYWQLSVCLTLLGCIWCCLCLLFLSVCGKPSLLFSCLDNQPLYVLVVYCCCNGDTLTSSVTAAPLLQRRVLLCLNYIYVHYRIVYIYTYTCIYIYILIHKCTRVHRNFYISYTGQTSMNAS